MSIEQRGGGLSNLSEIEILTREAAGVTEEDIQQFLSSPPPSDIESDPNKIRQEFLELSRGKLIFYVALEKFKKRTGSPLYSPDRLLEKISNVKEDDVKRIKNALSPEQQAEFAKLNEVEQKLFVIFDQMEPKELILMIYCGLAPDYYQAGLHNVAQARRKYFRITGKEQW